MECVFLAGVSSNLPFTLQHQHNLGAVKVSSLEVVQQDLVHVLYVIPSQTGFKGENQTPQINLP